MRPSRLAPLLALTILAFAGPAAAQGSQQLLDAARQLRANAERLKETLTPDARAAMLRQADMLEKQAGSAAAPPAGPGIADRIAAAHGGQLEWLTGHGACAGYTQANYLTWRHGAPDRTELDLHCKNAYGHWATYERVSRAGDKEAGETALEYYDAAARRAAGHRK